MMRLRESRRCLIRILVSSFSRKTLIEKYRQHSRAKAEPHRPTLTTLIGDRAPALVAGVAPAVVSGVIPE